MEAGQVHVVDLTVFGVPADAKILAVSYTPLGRVRPLEWHDNVPARHISGTVLHLLGLPIGKGRVPRFGNVSISVVWVRGEESDGWPYLVSALSAATASDYAPSLVFAQAAVEISMMPIIESRFRQHASADQVKGFMSDALTYGYALNVVLPYLCAELRIAKLPDAIRGSLNRLRKMRNCIIHEGTKAAAVSPEDTMEGLSAAAFGFEYMRYVQPVLSAGSSSSETSQNGLPKTGNAPLP